MKTTATISASGHVLCRDAITGEVLLDKHNAINFENMSVAIARGVSNHPDGMIFEMVFGNGGSTVDTLGVITYLPPNVQGENATLYNETFAKVVDSNSPANTAPANNHLDVSHTSNTFYSDVIVSCLLDYAEPPAQLAFDDAISDNDTDFIFDEMGLRLVDGRMVSHLVFHPIAKALNRRIEFIYTIRFTVS